MSIVLIVCKIFMVLVVCFEGVLGFDGVDAYASLAGFPGFDSFNCLDILLLVHGFGPMNKCFPRFDVGFVSLAGFHFSEAFDGFLGLLVLGSSIRLMILMVSTLLMGLMGPKVWMFVMILA